VATNPLVRKRDPWQSHSSSDVLLLKRAKPQLLCVQVLESATKPVPVLITMASAVVRITNCPAVAIPASVVLMDTDDPLIVTPACVAPVLPPPVGVPPPGVVGPLLGAVVPPLQAAASAAATK